MLLRENQRMASGCRAIVENDAEFIVFIDRSCRYIAVCKSAENAIIILHKFVLLLVPMKSKSGFSS